MKDSSRPGEIMTNVIEIDPLNDERWDAFVEAHPFGWLCHHSGWKRVLDASFTHMKGHYLAISENGSLKAALPLYEVRSWLFGRRLVSIPFATLSDPLISSRDEMDVLFDEALKLRRSQRISHIEIRTLMSGGLLGNDSMSAHLYHKHHYVKLESPPDVLMKKFDRSCVRQKISRALDSKLTLKGCTGEEDLKVFHKLHMLTRRERQGLPPKPYIFFKSLWDTFSSSNHVSVLLCQFEGKTIAGVMLFKFKNRVSIEIAAYDRQLLHLCPVHFLFWESFKMAHQEGYEILDFGSTPPSNKGLMDFKKRWNTAVTDLTNYYYPRRQVEACDRSESRTYRVMQDVFRRAPDPILLGIGRFFYRHLG
jgi:hypothetical protein